jgi:hypothetical protein
MQYESNVVAGMKVCCSLFGMFYNHQADCAVQKEHAGT